jgi:hypothetical protein
MIRCVRCVQIATELKRNCGRRDHMCAFTVPTIHSISCLLRAALAADCESVDIELTSTRRKWGPSPAKVIRSPLSITWIMELGAGVV